MSAISVTYVFSNGTTSDATQVNQNFTDVVNGLSDGTKTLTVAAIVAPAMTGPITVTGILTVSGAFSAQGALFRTSANTINGTATDRGYGIFGTTAALQMQIDENEIQVMSNNTPVGISINARGGSVTIASAGQGTTVGGSLTSTQAFGALSTSNFGGSTTYKATSVSTDVTIDATYREIFVDCSGAARTETLPTAVGNSGLVYWFYKTDSTTNTLTIDGSGAETIDGTTTIVLGGNTAKSRLGIVSDGANWRIKELYDEGAYTATLTGCTTSPTATVSYVRNGKAVSLRMSTLTGTSNTTACTITGCPAHLFPATGSNPIVEDVRDNTLSHIGVVSIGTGGVWTLFFYSAITTQTGTFTNVGTKGLGSLDITYTLQ